VLPARACFSAKIRSTGAQGAADSA
jgi:hypothetical protein